MHKGHKDLKSCCVEKKKWKYNISLGNTSAVRGIRLCETLKRKKEKEEIFQVWGQIIKT